MPFNKGDFTQQGVAGHVNANLRLNEKRLVNIDLTSNEEAEGCTITGTVKDLLNDKGYGIGAGVSGNIEITENGENINVAPYATATVNVSGGGMPMLTATVHNELNLLVETGEIFSGEGTPIRIDNCLYWDPYGIAGNETVTLNYPYVRFVGDEVSTAVLLFFKSTAEISITVSDTVNCTYDSENNALVITNTSLPASATITLSTVG